MTQDQAVATAVSLAAFDATGGSHAVHREGDAYNVDGKGTLYAYAQRWLVRDGVAEVQVRTRGARSEWVHIKLPE
jgi:hypothetical protein